MFAALGWWWSVRMSGDAMMGTSSMDHMDMPGMSMDGMASMTTHAMSFGGFILAWLAMMAAMMFPAIAPVVRLYARGAAAGRTAPLPFFVAGYIVVWTAIGVPAYFAWRELMEPVAEGMSWAAYLAAGTLIAAAVWQLTPLKSICLRHCRSPMSVFMRSGQSAARPSGALKMGVTHGVFCLGCCWALMAVLVAVGTMNLAWMIALAALIFLEKNARWGERIAVVAAVGLAVLGVTLIVRPETLSALT